MGITAPRTNVVISVYFWHPFLLIIIINFVFHSITIDASQASCFVSASWNSDQPILIIKELAEEYQMIGGKKSIQSLLRK